ncbi:hypothetical protein [Sphingobacterium yanglingense]|uniref:Uncharacterized protein n=1 Tax=Sphingobacterium yanglingense TaxID=1437280 RepID=A0A4R6WCZ8_9SPHI|nr:hypothetical protein [Sphingobacterium yanglingense]TDQ75649.1 hypothetical protein CLV99_3342 [Sphingobacterium yanglingense]
MKTNFISKLVSLKFLLFWMLFCALNIAQAQKVESFNRKISELAADEAASLKSLAYDLQPSTTVTKAQTGRMSRMSMPAVEQKAPAPRVAYVDAENLVSVDQLVPSLNSIELLRIKVSSVTDLGQSVDLTPLTDSNQLKYILFIFEYSPCEGENQDDCVRRSLSTIKGLDLFRGSILYKISIPR